MVRKAIKWSVKSVEMPGAVRLAHAQMGMKAPKIPQMPGRLRSRATVLGVVAVVVGGQPTVHPAVVHQMSTHA